MYRIVYEPNINRQIPYKELYGAQIVVQGVRLQKNHTDFTNEELFEISMGWMNMDLIQGWTPESYRKSKLKTDYTYLLIKK
jgi:hypothetical protein